MDLLLALWDWLTDLVALFAILLFLFWQLGLVEVRKCWGRDRGAFYVLSRRRYFAVIDHEKHPQLFTERHDRHPHYRKVRLGRWCIHCGKPREVTR